MSRPPTDCASSSVDTRWPPAQSRVHGPTSSTRPSFWSLVLLMMRFRSIKCPGLPGPNLRKVSIPDIFFPSSLFSFLVFSTSISLVEVLPSCLFFFVLFLACVVQPQYHQGRLSFLNSFALSHQPQGQPPRTAMPRNTADTQSSGSSVTGSTQTRNEDIFSDPALALVLKAATVHKTTENGKEEVTYDPREHTTVALWEDIFNKVFLVKYSNNSQWYPINQTDKQMDLCTFYFAPTKDGFRKISLIFTEAKRASNAEPTARQGERLYDLEIQLGDYCGQWLRAKRPDGAEDQLYANAVCGQYIRCFLVMLDPSNRQRVIMKDCIADDKYGRDTKVTKADYLDVSQVPNQRLLRAHFDKIKAAHPPVTPPRPASSSSGGEPPSIPGSQQSRKSSGSQEDIRMGSDKDNSPAQSPPRPAGTARRNPDKRSESPSDKNAVPIRQRSPPKP